MEDTDPSPRGNSQAAEEPRGEAPQKGRRTFLTAAAAGLAGTGIGAAGSLAATGRPHTNTDAERAAQPHTIGHDKRSFYGEHQAGLKDQLAAHGVFIALDLNPETDRSGLERMFRLLSDDAARLTQGKAPLADVEPELAEKPALLSITFGVGAMAVERAGATAPSWLRPLPKFEIDKLEPEFSGGDVLIVIQSHDPVALAHAQRILLRDARAFGSIRWVQKGFRHAHGTTRPGVTQRNLFGQVDGTVNPSGADFDRCVWIEDGWLRGGTSMVLRRIAMNLDTWDQVDRTGREFAIGRTLSTGAPLTGEYEGDEPDFAAKDSLGFPAIDTHAHIRRARVTERPGEKPEQRIVRRPFSYDDPPANGQTSNAGLIFVALQRDVDAQFVPIQQRLSDGDLLNTWTTPIGSAVFAILPGCQEGGFVGETLFH